MAIYYALCTRYIILYISHNNMYTYIVYPACYYCVYNIGRGPLSDDVIRRISGEIALELYRVPKILYIICITHQYNN